MSLLTTFLYQPFFNLLVGYYYLLDQIPGNQADMGVAVILLTLTIRFLLFPLTLASTRTKNERKTIEESIHQIKLEFKHQPHRQKEATRHILKSNRRIVVSEAINFTIQMFIFFILYRIFATGLKGADLHLIYDFMPPINTPFHLIFLDRYDLTQPNLTLNLIQSLTILAVEAVGIIDSPFPTSRTDFIRYVIILPLASFIIFMFLPAGKKLFVITTLIFSFTYTLLRILYRHYQKLLDHWQNLGIKPSPETPSNTPPAS